MGQYRLRHSETSFPQIVYLYVYSFDGFLLAISFLFCNLLAYIYPTHYGYILSNETDDKQY